jgi:hypothetical protein
MKSYINTGLETQTPYLRRWLIAALFSVLTLVGCKSETESPGEIKQQAFAELRTDIEFVMQDKDRATKAQAIVGELEKRLLQIEQNRIAGSKKYRALNANYDTPRQAFVDLYDEIMIEAKQNQVAVTRLHRELLSITTEGEWSELGKSHRHALDSTIAMMRSI